MVRIFHSLLWVGFTQAIRLTVRDLSASTDCASDFQYCQVPCGPIIDRSENCASESCFCPIVLDNGPACVTCLDSRNSTLAAEINEVFQECLDIPGPQPPTDDCADECNPLFEDFVTCQLDNTCICKAATDDASACQKCLLKNSPNSAVTKDLDAILTSCKAPQPSPNQNPYPHDCDYACVNVFVAYETCLPYDYQCLCAAGVSTRTVNGKPVSQSCFGWGTSDCQKCVAKYDPALAASIGQAQAICKPATVPTTITVTIVTVTGTKTITTTSKQVVTSTVYPQAPTGSPTVVTKTITVTRTRGSYTYTSTNYVTTTSYVSTPTNKPYVAPPAETVVYVTKTVTVTMTSGSSTSSKIATRTYVSTITAKATTVAAAKTVAPVVVKTVTTTNAAGKSQTVVQTYTYTNYYGNGTHNATATYKTSSVKATATPVRVLYPRLIVPVQSAQPKKSFGTQYIGTVNTTQEIVVVFDIPRTQYMYNCSLEFLLPGTGANPGSGTSSYELVGSSLNATQLAAEIASNATYKSLPKVSSKLGLFTLKEGSSSTLKVNTTCIPGSAISIKLTSVNKTSLTWFEDYNPPPVGIVLNQY